VACDRRRPCHPSHRGSRRRPRAEPDRSGGRPGRVTDQLLAGLVESCRRLGVPTGKATGVAYALGVVHTLDLLEQHLTDGPCLEAYVYMLYIRAALLADRPDPKERP
jgi:hypothetical protein